MTNWLFTLENLIVVGGVLHFGILLASAAVPKVLDWRASLREVDSLTREIVWVHGVFIVLVIVAFGLVSIWFSSELADGTVLARAICGFIAVFWGMRLMVQFFVFDAKLYLKTALLRVGYHGLTIVFLFHVVVYGAAAVLNS